MSIQLHKRLPREFIEGILEAFDGYRIGEDRLIFADHREKE